MTEDEIIEVVTAFKEGKEIEVRSSGYPTWDKCSNPSWSFSTAEYRIKPQPEYVPFTWEDRELFRDKWIRLKGAENEHKINFIGSNDTVSCANWEGRMNLIELFKSYEFIDGSIFGKLKQ